MIKIGPERLEGDWSQVDEICKFKDGLDDPEHPTLLLVPESQLVRAVDLDSAEELKLEIPRIVPKFNTMDEFFFK